MVAAAQFRVDPKLASLLGENYRSTEYALKELVDNAWDADATEVDIHLPGPMTSAPVVVKDNGCGMTELELREHYLVVAKDRRSAKGDRTEGLKRLVKGRKGVGKFAGLMIANEMAITTEARGTRTSVSIERSILLDASKDLEAVDLPIESSSIGREMRGTTITLNDLNQNYALPIPEKLKAILMEEYGREPDFAISVNGERLGVEDLRGQHFAKQDHVDGAGEVSISLNVSDGTKKYRRPGIVLKVDGKVVGKPSDFGLSDDPEVPEKLLKKVYGEVEVSGWDGAVTADWSTVIENSKPMIALQPVVQSFLKQAIEQTWQKEVQLQKARLAKEIKLRLAHLPEYRRQYAQEALDRVLRRFYGESDDKVQTVVNVVIDAFEKDEYFEVLRQLDESKDRDVEAIADALQVFGLVDMAVVAKQARGRMRLLDHLEAIVRDERTLEKTVHDVIEKNLWVLAPHFAHLKSNQTLKTTVEAFTDKAFQGKKADLRPDLLLASRVDGGHLLIEFKRPSIPITRLHQAQAQEYRDELRPVFPSIEILVIGEGRDDGVLKSEDPPGMQVFSYLELVSNARDRLAWLVDDLKQA